ncbi:MAG: hypothetical protein HUK21_09895 [Fibrobacteraceae bacterium]|mgnify:CR=1 FL=1|nr:hypothetical protein [Fibrobacteraceae bacterium]
MIFAKAPFEKVGNQFKIPCEGAENGFAVVDLIMNEDAAKYTDNINIMDGAFTIVDHDTKNERTVYPFNNFGLWVWAEKADEINKVAAKDLKPLLKYYNDGNEQELPFYTFNESTGRTEIQDKEFFFNAEKYAMNEPIFNIGTFNEFLGYNNGKNPLENIPEAIVGSAFAMWIKVNDYDKDIEGFIALMHRW